MREGAGVSVGSQGTGGGGCEGPMELSGDITPFFRDSFFLGGWIFTPSDMGTASSRPPLRLPSPAVWAGKDQEPISLLQQQGLKMYLQHLTGLYPEPSHYHEGYGTDLYEPPLPCTYTSVALPTKRSAFSTLWVKKQTKMISCLIRPFPVVNFPSCNFISMGRRRRFPHLLNTTWLGYTARLGQSPCKSAKSRPANSSLPPDKALVAFNHPSSLQLTSPKPK